MLIKERAFASLSNAISTLGSLAVAPSKGHDVEPEYQNYIEEHVVIEDDVRFNVICVWGTCDYFIIHDKDPDNVVIIDGPHVLDPFHCPQLPAELLDLIKRCALVGYVPINLLNAIRQDGREITYDLFSEAYGELVEYIEDMLERFEAMVELQD